VCSSDLVDAAQDPKQSLHGLIGSALFVSAKS
jgi:hypothetical protein